MCGICGVVSFDHEPDLPLVLNMVGLLSHRGPDGSGYLRDHCAVLGHSRLSLIDPAGGAQPIGNEDGTVWVTFNGEIFNYVELAAELRGLGHRFATHCDTEVIVHAWEQWGPGCFDRFNGQWAIGIWDRSRRRLVLARDRLGVRPLYYRRSGRTICFASEIKALLADPSAPRELDPAGIDQVLTYWSTIAPQTPFAGISQLPPGQLAVFDEDGLECAPYWQLEFPDRGAEACQDLEQNAQRLRELLVAATKLRFERSDFPVGAYLSGGIDSSVTAAAIRQFTDADLATFSLRFADAEFDEGEYQQLMVRRLETHHSELVVTNQDIADVFPDVVWHTESPILRSAPAPMFLLSRLVRSSGYKVVVTGEGADEILGGYDIFREGRVRSFWAADPDSAVRGRAVELLYPWLQRNPSQAPAFARSFFGQNLDANDPYTSHRPRWAAAAAIKSMLTPSARADAAAGGPALPARAASWDPLSRAQWLELTTLLPGYILASQGDRMLMANSVEGRFPFLDRDVVDFSNAVPARHKLFGLDEKFLLKLAFADLVPEEIRSRPKQPYRAPDAAAFFCSGPGPDWLDDLLAPDAVRRAGVFQPEQVSGLIAKARAKQGRLGNTDNMRLLAVVSTHLLYDQFVLGDIAGRASGVPEPVHAIDLVNAGG